MPGRRFITTKTGFSMPIIGLGTWQSTEEDLERGLDCALSSGYRYIDTATFYGNEKSIGKVLKTWLESGKLKREDLCVVTKLPFTGNRACEVETYMDLSLENLQLDYVDVYLIHCPFTCVLREDGSYGVDNSTDLIAIWKEMEKLVTHGKTRAIGVSNFNIDQVERILSVAEIRPVTNQVELHAYLQQPELVHYLQSNDIIVTGYSPLGSPGAEQFFRDTGAEKEIPNIMQNPVVVELSHKYGKTPAQILLRHLIQKNVVVIPKSVNPKRVAENIDIFDFKINADDMKKLDGLDCNRRILHFKDLFDGVENHPEYPF